MGHPIISICQRISLLNIRIKMNGCIQSLMFGKCVILILRCGQDLVMNYSKTNVEKCDVFILDIVTSFQCVQALG